jgi:hypothetical protein
MASSSTTGHIVSRNLNHRVIGLVNFDAPFLGLHPCVLRTGIGRLFGRKADTNNQGKETLQDNKLSLHDNDPNFNPTWTNDVNQPRWKGRNGALHFVAKHSHHLSRSALQYVFSYYDHAGCLNDYLGLLKRDFAAWRLQMNHLAQVADESDSLIITRLPTEPAKSWTDTMTRTKYHAIMSSSFHTMLQSCMRNTEPVTYLHQTSKQKDQGTAYPAHYSIFSQE